MSDAITLPTRGASIEELARFARKNGPGHDLVVYLDGDENVILEYRDNENDVILTRKTFTLLCDLVEARYRRLDEVKI